MKRTALVLLMATLALAVACVGLVRREQALAASLPPVVKVTSVQFRLLRNHDKTLVPILGTGSMQPLIPASSDPDDVVALAALDRRAFDLLGEGALIVFRTPRGYIIHRLEQFTPEGWITSGSHNARYDSGRVTAGNYVGVAVKIYTRG